MRRGAFWGGVLIMLVCGLLTRASATTYIEDFTTVDYQDPDETTAYWDTAAGELKLFPLAISEVGWRDTAGHGVGLALAGDRVYIADHTGGLLIVDISDPEEPLLEATVPTSSIIRGVATRDNLVYLAKDTGGFSIVWAETANSPQSMGGEPTPGHAYDVWVSGDYAYVADDDGGLQVIDITDSMDPWLAGSTSTPGRARAVEVHDDYAFIADYDMGMLVVDVSDPTSPSAVESWPTAHSCRDLTISGNYAYVADYTGGLLVIDITDPLLPEAVGSLDTDGLAVGIMVDGDQAYLADYSAGVKVIDISDPTNPTLMASHPVANYTYAVAAAGEHAYMVNWDQGLIVLETRQAIAPKLHASESLPRYMIDVAVDGNYAYMVGERGLISVDISNPGNPVDVGTWTTDPNIFGYNPELWTIDIDGDRAYVAGEDSRFYVLDISDPTTPVKANWQNTSGWYTTDIEVDGGYAYLANESRFAVMDVGGPSYPTALGYWEPSGSGSYVHGQAVDGYYAYIGTGAGIGGPFSLTVLSAGNPAAPDSVGAMATSSMVKYIALDGDLLIAACDDLLFVDVTDANVPVLRHTYSYSEPPCGITIQGDLALVCYGQAGVAAFDITSAAYPQLLGFHDTPYRANGVALAGDMAYVADLQMSGGLQVLQAYARDFDPTRNLGLSDRLNSYDQEIYRVRVTSTQVGDVALSITANAGGDWQPIVGDGGWNVIAATGTDLRWRSEHFVTYGSTVNPTCSQLDLEWQFNCAMIDSIVDVPADQGGWVRVHFTASGRDDVVAPEPIASYTVWRSFDGAKDLPPGNWEALGNVDAVQMVGYTFLAPTEADSSAGSGAVTSYCVTAHTTTPSLWFACEPESGYSVDNIAPAVPGGLTLGSSILAWSAPVDADFQYFSVYGSTVDALDESAVLIGHTITTSRDVTGQSHAYYLVTATDHAGNQSAAAAFYAASDVPGQVARFALHPNVPNPFNPATTICFELPRAGQARLAIYTVEGRLVRVLVDGACACGRNEFVWDGRDGAGQQAASGVYVYRVQADTFEDARRMLLIK